MALRQGKVAREGSRLSSLPLPSLPQRIDYVHIWHRQYPYVAIHHNSQGAADAKRQRYDDLRMELTVGAFSETFIETLSLVLSSSRV